MKYFLDQSVCVGGSKICIISRAQSTKKKKEKNRQLSFFQQLIAALRCQKPLDVKRLKKQKTKKLVQAKPITHQCGVLSMQKLRTFVEGIRIFSSLPHRQADQVGCFSVFSYNIQHTHNRNSFILIYLSLISFLY